MNLSFAGCGFLGIYHIGVAAAIKEYAPDLIADKISGASAGALAACSLVCGCSLGEATSGVLRITKQARSRSLGPLHPSFDLVRYLRNGLKNLLPENAHRLASGRLFLSLTRFQDGENVLVSEFNSREELIDAVVAGSFIPFYCGTFPPVFRGTSYVDGGLSDNLPIIDEHTITVSPFSGEADICPQDRDSASIQELWLKNTSIRFTSQNMRRLSIALFPPELEEMNDMCRQGFEDGLRFLATHDLISCARCITIRSSIMLSSTEPVIVLSDDGKRVKLTTQRIIPKNISAVNLASGTETGQYCELCRETASDASAKGLPETIRDSFISATALEKSILTYVQKFKAVTLMRYFALPFTLPLSVYCSLATNLKCRVTISEVDYANVSAKVNNCFGTCSFLPVSPELPFDLVFTPPSSGCCSVAVTENKDVCPSVTSLKHVYENTAFARLLGLINSSKASQACRTSVDEVRQLVHELQSRGVQRSTYDDVSSPLTEMELRSIDVVLTCRNKGRPLMSFYYIDEENSLKLTEIFALDSSDNNERGYSKQQQHQHQQ